MLFELFSTIEMMILSCFQTNITKSVRPGLKLRIVIPAGIT
jgi:hypothetical protein